MTDEVMNGGIEAALDAWWAADPGPTDTSYREAMGAAIRAYLSATPAQTKGDDLEILGCLNWSEVHGRRYYDETPRGQREPWPLVRLSEAASRIQSLTASNEALIKERTSLIETKREQLATAREAVMDAQYLYGETGLALETAQAEIARLRGQVERAFKDGVHYATIVEVANTDEARDEAWHMSTARTALTPQEPEGGDKPA